MPDYEDIANGVRLPGPAAPETDAIIDPSAQHTFYPVSHPKYQGLAEEKGYDQSHNRINKCRYSHEAMIDVIVANPSIKQNELAKTFDKSVPWVSRIIGSDAFQAALAKRREEVTDPYLIATIEERFKGLANQSLDILAEKLNSSQNADLALKALDVSVKALGFGARQGPGQLNQFVIQLPAKSTSPETWLSEASPIKQIGSDNA